MLNLRRTTATLGAAALVAAPLTLMTAAPASAAEREFRVAGADVDFEVEKDDGRFEVEVDIDDAKPGSRWRVVLWQDGKRYHKRVHTADRDGDVEIDKNRRNTAGKDVFKVKVKKIGGPKAKTRVITLR
jgi:hypothetical protein